MSDFRDRLAKGSFRGVEFFTDSHNFSSGRRVAIHEYPYQETPYAEDLGRKADKFKLEVFTLGNNYDIARDKLIEALLTEGVGILVHPYRGKNEVTVENFSVTESKNKQGIAKFSIDFRLAGVAPKSPQIEASYEVDTKQELALGQLHNDFENNYLTNLNIAEQEQTKSFWKSVVENAKKLMRNARLAVVKLNQINRQIQSFKQDLDNILLTPKRLTGALGGIYSSLFNLKNTLETDYIVDATANLEVLQLNRFFDNELKNSQNNNNSNGSGGGGTAPAPSIKVQKNQQAIASYITRMSAVYAVEQANNLEYSSITEAREVDRDLQNWLEELENTQNIELFFAIKDLSNSITKSIKQKGEKLNHAQTTIISKPIPSVLLAHVLNCEEKLLLEQNKIRDPLFVNGELKYVNN